MFVTCVLHVLHGLVAIVLLPTSGSTPGPPSTGVHGRSVTGSGSVLGSRGGSVELHTRGGRLSVQSPAAGLLDTLQLGYAQRKGGTPAVYAKRPRQRIPALGGERV